MKTLTKRTKNSKIPPSLRPLGIITNVSRQPECKIADCFTDKMFMYRYADFDNLLFYTFSATAEVSVSGYELTKVTTEAELARVGKPFTNPKQIEDLILRTENGENTGLITPSSENMFLLKTGSSIVTVRAHRSPSGWPLHLDSFYPRFEWCAGHRFFCPAT